MNATLAPNIEPTSTPAGLLDDPAMQGRFTRWFEFANGRREAESSLLIAGMHCAACAGIVEATLRGLPGVLQAEVSASAHRCRVRWDSAQTQPSAWQHALRRVGYDAAADSGLGARAMREAERRGALWRLFVASFCAMQVMMLAWPSYTAEPGEISADLLQLLNWGSWLLSLPVLLFASASFFRGAHAAWRARRMGMDVPVALGILVAFVASTGATFAPGGLFGHEVYFDSLTMFVSFLLAARYLEMHLRHGAQQALERATADLPQSAWREGSNGQPEEVGIAQLQAGDTLQVPLGQLVPADGELLEGSAHVDEALLTGESTPVPKQAGDELVAGSLNLGQPLRMRVLRMGAQTRYESILALMRAAATQRPASAAVADRLAGPFLWAVLGLAAAGAAAWSVVDPTRAIGVAVAVLVVTCPCALSLATPATLVATAAGLARRGVLVQHLDGLERAARLSHVAFDKTGTLADERPRCTSAVLLKALGCAADERSALALAAGLAGRSAHPLSRAIACLNERAPFALAQVQELPGLGMQGIDAQGRTWRLGAFHWAAVAEASMTSRVVLGAQGQAIMAFEFEEGLRPGAAQAMQDLRSAGLGLSLITGDQAQRANAAAAVLGIEMVHACATPQDKLRAIQALQAAGHVVAMVGDGVNDAPVLAQADVSFAMGHGAVAARAQADMVLLRGKPADVVAALAAAKKAMRIVRQNLGWAAFYNAACIPLALGGFLPPWAAGLGMAASSLAVVLNALRAGH